jgi:hypothetical protein
MALAAYILAQTTKAKHNHVNEWIHIKTSNRKKATLVNCNAEGDTNHPVMWGRQWWVQEANRPGG